MDLNKKRKNRMPAIEPDIDAPDVPKQYDMELYQDETTGKDTNSIPTIPVKSLYHVAIRR